MEYGIVRYGASAYHTLSSEYPTCKIATRLSSSETNVKWESTLAQMGFNLKAEEPQIEDLFRFVKEAFEKIKGTKINVELVRGYVASIDGTLPISSNEASRLYSNQEVIYVDELVINALFDYIATYYIWAKDYKDESVFAFCFKYTATMLNYVSRLGLLTNDTNKAQLIAQIASRCDDRGVELIADLYWSCLAFAFCHEIAHIYLDHAKQTPKNLDELWSLEYEADAVGYDVYLHIIESIAANSKEAFAGVFHDYLYTAPMILFKHYEDVYFLCYWLFGEKTGISHPPLSKRINALLQISEQDQYTFDTYEGNILLNNYLDVSDWFREQLILKLQRGKLNNFIQEGVAFMQKSGYSEALQFQKDMCNDLKIEADALGLDSNLVIGLWDTSVDIELLNSPGDHAFVWSYGGKTYSTKAFNVRFSLKKVMISVFEFGGTFQMPEGAVKTVMALLMILCKLIDISTVQLNESLAQVLIRCHQLNVYDKPIREEELLKMSEATEDVITELSRLGCVEIDNGTIRLRERIFIS